MINREDMLELTRRMTLARTSFTRIADFPKVSANRAACGSCLWQ